MPLDIAKLRSVMDLERRKNFTDTAVIGGFDRFLNNWAEEAGRTFTDRARANRLSEYIKRFDYAAFAVDKRPEALADLLATVTALETPESPNTPRTVRKTPSVKPVAGGAGKRNASTPVHPASSLDLPVTALKGVNETTGAKLKKLGISTIRDMLYHFPSRHVDYSRTTPIAELSPGPEQTIVATVWEVRLSTPGGRRSTEAILGDETGNIRALWFNNPFLVRQIHANDRLVISGKIGVFKNTLVFESPEWEKLENKELVHTGRLAPIYPLTAGLFPRQMRKLMKEVVDTYAPSLEEYLPEAIRTRRRLPVLPEAVAQAHFPDDYDTKDAARTRLAFDELFVLQLGVMARKRAWRISQPGLPMPTDENLLRRFISSLAFELTGAQRRALADILNDMKQSEAMSRLLQGDVGSGKTVVATAAALVSVAAGYQTAIMAPTEILAEQHFRSITGMLEVLASERQESGGVISYLGILPDRPLTVALLIGDAKESGKKAVRGLIHQGGIDLVIGTHSLVQKSLKFKRLGLAVIDEQHRFGVEQRQNLRQKGNNPHLLVMTATPIPRTLALTLYGDLDLSVIDELPPGRQVIRTRWLKPEQRASAYAFIRKQVELKQQAFIICPLVEESEAVQARAATAEYEKLKMEIFPEYRLGLIHGRMSAAEKESVMKAFDQARLDILVSTPVIEVGIDIPNATVMLIESADRFGLSQLHQFRGRVGRGREQSYCMLLADKPSEVANARLSVIENNQDGFALAEEDLKLRGPGEFFGTRQSGLPDLKMARLSDVHILEAARAEAERLFDEDPELKQEEHRRLYFELTRVWPQAGELS